MRYIVRAVKYFITICLLLLVMMAIITVVQHTEFDVNVIFRNGMKSVYQLLGAFAAISALYPMFGYIKKGAIVPGSYEETRDGVIAFMRERHYVLESEEGETLKFRSASMFTRVSRFFEDRITLSRELAGYKVEGLRKDVVRIACGLESRFRSNS